MMAKCDDSHDFMEVFGGSEDKQSDFEDFQDAEDLDGICDDDNLDDIFDYNDHLEPEAFPALEDSCESYDDYMDTFLDDDDDDDDDDGSLSDTGDDDTADNDEQWSTELHNYKPKAFSGPPPGPTRPLEAAAKELDFFYLAFPPSLIQLLAEETNRFAEQKQDGNPSIPRWKPVSVEEMKVFLGIRIYMSIIVVPETRMYWEKSKIFGMFYVRNIMSAKRFKEISLNFSANDQKKQHPEGDPNYDKLYEVRPVLNEVLARCLQEYNPHPSCLIHASNISYNARFRHLMPKKPYNMRVLIRTDSVSGYCCEFLVYVGEVNHEEEKKEPEKRFPSRMVTELCQRLRGFNYVITMSSYFTTPLLIKNLHSMDILARGTVCRKLKWFPHALLSQTPVSKQGDSAVVQEGSMSAYAYAWCNRRVVRLVSTADDPKVMSTLEWEHRGRNKAVPYPSVLKEYNDCMGRMEKLDKSRTEHPTARWSSRWWVYLFWCLFDIAVSNAFILMKESPAHQRFTRSGNRKTLKIDTFRENLCMQLMAH